MIFTTRLSFACGPARDAMTSCNPVRISRAEVAVLASMVCRYQKGRRVPMRESLKANVVRTRLMAVYFRMDRVPLRYTAGIAFRYFLLALFSAVM
jgi:hypothetical protein